jgi:hypothetical protein
LVEIAGPANGSELLIFDFHIKEGQVGAQATIGGEQFHARFKRRHKL